MQISKRELQDIQCALGSVLDIIDNTYPQTEDGTRAQSGPPSDPPEETVACLVGIEPEVRAVFDSLSKLIGD